MNESREIHAIRSARVEQIARKIKMRLHAVESLPSHSCEISYTIRRSFSFAYVHIPFDALLRSTHSAGASRIPDSSIVTAIRFKVRPANECRNCTRLVKMFNRIGRLIRDSQFALSLPLSLSLDEFRISVFCRAFRERVARAGSSFALSACSEKNKTRAEYHGKAEGKLAPRELRCIFQRPSVSIRARIARAPANIRCFI